MDVIRDFYGYKVSSCGQVFNLDGTIKKTFLAGKGYRCFSVYKEGKKTNYLVHRAVAVLFIPNDKNLDEVNHIDGNKENNDISNLEWCTSGQNIKHAFTNGLHHQPRKPVKMFDKDGLLLKVFLSIREAAKQVGVNESSIRKSCNGKITVKGCIFTRAI